MALAGTFGYELHITRIPEEDRKMIPDQVKMYHKYNDLVRTGDYYRIASFRENRMYDCYMVVAKDKSEALMTYIQVMGRPNSHSRRILLKGMAPEKDLPHRRRRTYLYRQNPDAGRYSGGEPVGRLQGTSVSYYRSINVQKCKMDF